MKTDAWAHEEGRLLKREASCHVSSVRQSLYQITGFSEMFAFMG